MIEEYNVHGNGDASVGLDGDGRRTRNGESGEDDGGEAPVDRAQYGGSRGSLLVGHIDGLELLLHQLQRHLLRVVEA